MAKIQFMILLVLGLVSSVFLMPANATSNDTFWNDVSQIKIIQPYYISSKIGGVELDLRKIIFKVVKNELQEKLPRVEIGDKKLKDKKISKNAKASAVSMFISSSVCCDDSDEITIAFQVEYKREYFHGVLDGNTQIKTQYRTGGRIAIFKTKPNLEHLTNQILTETRSHISYMVDGIKSNNRD